MKKTIQKRLYDLLDKFFPTPQLSFDFNSAQWDCTDDFCELEHSISGRE